MGRFCAVPSCVERLKAFRRGSKGFKRLNPLVHLLPSLGGIPPGASQKHPFVCTPPAGLSKSFLEQQGGTGTRAPLRATMSKRPITDYPREAGVHEHIAEIARPLGGKLAQAEVVEEE